MTAFSGPSLPGVTSGRSTSPRLIFKSDSQAQFLPGGVVVDGASSRDAGNTGDLDVLRDGLLMGKITSGGQYAPSVYGPTTNAEAVGSTSIEASAATITELVRRKGATGTFKLIGPGSANGVNQEETVTYSAASGTTITVTAITHNFVAGSFICPVDGSEYPVSLMYTGDHAGLKVTDVDAASQDTPWALVPIGGMIDSSQIINWPSDTSLQAWITDNLRGNTALTFDDLF